MAFAGISNTGLITAANIAQAAAVAVATTNTIAAIDIAGQQSDLADDYLTIAKQQNDYYYEVYAPCEDIELSEACSAPLYEPKPDIQIGRHMNAVRNNFAGVSEKELQCVSRYCTGRKSALIKDLAVSEASALAALGNMGRRYEEQYEESINDLRWARRAEALARGRDMMAQAVNFSGFAFGIFGRLGDQAEAGASGALNYLSYSDARRETQYPARNYPPRVTAPSSPPRAYQLPELPQAPRDEEVVTPRIRG